MILLLDNYDSFVFNLQRYFIELGQDCFVVRNDQITLDEIRKHNPSHIVLSPGPCTPNEAGICLDVVTAFAATVPILGVCLGHQVIGQVFGGRIVRAKQPMHGKSALIQHDQTDIFDALPNPLRIGRYHSLVVSCDALPECLQICATSDEGEIMALRHKQYPCYGLQFHPESVLTEGGHLMLSHFLNKEVSTEHVL